MRFPPPPERADADHPSRCPECGSGDLFTLAIRQRDGAAWCFVYCAGAYDRDRRRFLRRSCGYASRSVQVTSGGGPDTVALSSAGEGAALAARFR
jgi:hypothetical protein